jgi:hypothetical protein
MIKEKFQKLDKQTQEYFINLANTIKNIDTSLTIGEQELIKRKTMIIWEFLEQQHKISIKIDDIFNFEKENFHKNN